MIIKLISRALQWQGDFYTTAKFLNDGTCFELSNHNRGLDSEKHTLHSPKHNIDIKHGEWVIKTPNKKCRVLTSDEFNDEFNDSLIKG